MRGVLGTIRKRLMKTSCKAMLKLCLVANNFGTFGNTIEAMGIHLFCCIHSGEKTASHDVVQDVFAFIVKDARFQILQKQTHVFPLPFFFVFLLTGWHCFISWWHSHLSKPSITGSSFSWGGYNTSNFNEGKALSQPLPNGCVFPSCHKGFWVSSTIVQQLLSSMC